MNIKYLLKKIIPVSYKKLEEECEKNKQELLVKINALKIEINQQNEIMNHIVDLNIAQKKAMDIQTKNIGELYNFIKKEQSKHELIVDVLDTQKREIEKIEILLENILKENSLIEDSLNIIKGITNEGIWGQIFNNTISDSDWLKNKTFSPGRWALGYPALYVLYRVLNEFRPRNILELGLGQSTMMTTQYAASDLAINHIIVEHDNSWIDFFENSKTLSKNSRIIQRNLSYVPYKDADSVRTYENFKVEIPKIKYDLILIDAPLGGDMKEYARIDVLSILPECLADKFVIILDDANRIGEKHTIKEIDNKLLDCGIKAKHRNYSGIKESCIWTSEGWEFLLTM